MDWNTVLGAASGFLLVYGLAGTIYLTAAWLRSRRKRPGPRWSRIFIRCPQCSHEWEVETSSQATGTSEAIGPGSDGSSRS